MLFENGISDAPSPEQTEDYRPTEPHWIGDIG